VCCGLQNSTDLGETVPFVCSETCLTVCGGGSEVSDIKVEEVLPTQQEEEEDPLAIALPPIKIEHEVRIDDCQYSAV
jgi:hypothetical protein